MKTCSPAFLASLAMGTFLAVTAMAPSALAATVFTETVVSNISEPSFGNFNIGNPLTLTNVEIAQAFTTGSGVIFTNVTLAMKEAWAFSPGVFSVQLWSDASGLPGSLLLPLTGTTTPWTAGNYIYTPPSAFLLSNVTTYWIVATTCR